MEDKKLLNNEELEKVAGGKIVCPSSITSLGSPDGPVIEPPRQFPMDDPLSVSERPAL